MAVAHHQPIGVDACAPSPCQEGTQGCASCTWSRGGEPERVQTPSLTEHGQASCDVITTDGVEDVIDSLSIRCATDHLDEILHMSVDGSSPQRADDVRLGCGCRGPDLRDPRPTTELERSGPHATATAMDEDPVLRSQMSEVVQHVMCGEVGHGHGRGRLEAHIVREAHRAIGGSHQWLACPPFDIAATTRSPTARPSTSAPVAAMMPLTSYPGVNG